ncbi:MAG: TIGR00159 family protein [Candidatus Brocadia sp.]|nr:TIGR00159 family protein [Candidatus Brocadia sp.]MCE7911548.1 TIGR00159 family protein [Candidatus Brocadia sp. AMX3]MDG5997583.1 TIGR00159 family protein [Candidatus Brocadia sp.]RIK01129.1 MAG: TIGR00159 family protein [Candidatus Brocadia sp.]UJS21494.1 MAG: diadenylate cyclase CdaA [Candidatus Brocadia sp.]
MFESISGLFKNISGWMIGRSLGEIFLIFMVVYVVLRIMQGTSGTSILRGLAFIIVLISIGVLFFVRKLQLFTIDWLITEFVPVFIIPIIILFQPEFRRALLRLGQNPVFSMFLKSEQQEMTYEIIQAVEYLSKNRIGALIAIERDIGLGNFVETGTKLHADVSRDLLNTIFWPGSPLHDGAVIIQEQKISAAGCLLPLTEKTELSRSLGTRHRAGIGLTEETDALVIIVSEETGTISTGFKGTLNQGVDEKGLKKILDDLSTERFSVAKSTRGR